MPPKRGRQRLNYLIAKKLMEKKYKPRTLPKSQLKQITQSVVRYEDRLPRRSRIFRQPTKLNDTQRIVLKLNSEVTVNCTSAESAEYSYKVNDIYESRTGVHQPYLRDQIEPYFTRYRVLGCKYRITFKDIEATHHTLYVRISDSDITQTTNTQNFMLESPNAKHKRMMTPYVTNTPYRTVTFSGYIDLKKLMARDDYYATTAMSTSPTQPFYIWVGVANKASATVTSTIYANVTLEYDTHFTIPDAIPGQS